MKGVAAAAPTRIDLAGGTLDIWPLALMADRPVTVNAAIDLRARCLAEARRDGRIVIVSRDQKRRADRPAGRPPRNGEPLELLVRLALALGPRTGVTLETDCAAPAGSGLGGSSSLAIAVASALGRLTGRSLSRSRRLAVVRDLETQVLGIPAGEQDYVAALHGGASAIEWRPGGGVRTALDVDFTELRSRTILCYSGASRSSARSNWDMVRRRIDGDARVARALDGVAAAAREMREALTAGRWDRAGRILAEEMTWRERLSPFVATGPIRPLLAAARRAGAWGGKVCGAGGGGCLVFLAPEGRTGAVAEALRSLGAEVLPFQFVRAGATVTSKPTSRLVRWQYPLRAMQ